jgi:pre-mycofactocin synthase
MISWRRRTFSSVTQAQAIAKRRLPASVYRYVQGGNDGRASISDNLQAFAQIGFRPKCATLFQERNLSTTILGRYSSMPVVLAPAGFIRLAHRDAEKGAAEAAGDAGIPIGLSTLSSCAVEDVAAATKGPVWYQLYFAGGRTTAEHAIARAEAAHCAALVLSVDIPGQSKPRWGDKPTPVRIDRRNALAYAPEMITRPAWLYDFLRDGLHLDVPNVRTAPGEAPLSVGEAALSMKGCTPTWSDLGWIREAWSGPIVVKGVFRPDDARRAVDHGAQAVVVSTHGGNALDGTPSPLRALPSVLEAVGAEIEVLVDGGVRSGMDVVKAVALGARAVLIGRAYVWGLAAGGKDGVRQVLQLLQSDIDYTLAFLGCSEVGQLGSDCLDLPFAWPARFGCL